MWLSVATWRDACFHIVQDNKYTAFLENTSHKLEAKCPPYLKGGKSRTGKRKSSSHHAKRKLI